MKCQALKPDVRTGVVWFSVGRAGEEEEGGGERETRGESKVPPAAVKNTHKKKKNVVQNFKCNSRYIHYSK